MLLEYKTRAGLARTKATGDVPMENVESLNESSNLTLGSSNKSSGSGKNNLGVDNYAVGTSSSCESAREEGTPGNTAANNLSNVLRNVQAENWQWSSRKQRDKQG